MKAAIRKYHRQIAIAVCLPLIVTAVTGIGMAITDEWFHQDELVGFLIKIHTFQIFRLSAILPILNGLGLLGLIVTGLNMTGLFSKRHQPKQPGKHL